MARKEHFTLRLMPDTLFRLERQATRRGEPKSVLAEQLIEEGIRMMEHPSIIFRDGPAGRRPGLAGCGLDVWEVIETVRNEGGDISAAARYLNIAPHLVSSAAGYYVDYPEEIDAWIALVGATAAEAEDAWRRRQELLTG
jgi:hypothetical protein